MQLEDKDLKITYFKGSGAGGQHRNKTESCVRIVHLPSGVKAEGTSQRKRHQNLRVAKAILSVKLQELQENLLKELKKQEKLELNRKVRTYNKSRNSVKDHRTNKHYNFNSLLEGDLDEMLEDLKQNSYT